MEQHVCWARAFFPLILLTHGCASTCCKMMSCRSGQVLLSCLQAIKTSGVARLCVTEPGVRRRLWTIRHQRRRPEVLPPGGPKLSDCCCRTFVNTEGGGGSRHRKHQYWRAKLCLLYVKSKRNESLSKEESVRNFTPFFTTPLTWKQDGTCNCESRKRNVASCGTLEAVERRCSRATRNATGKRRSVAEHAPVMSYVNTFTSL